MTPLPIPLPLPLRPQLCPLRYQLCPLRTQQWTPRCSRWWTAAISTDQTKRAPAKLVWANAKVNAIGTPIVSLDWCAGIATVGPPISRLGVEEMRTMNHMITAMTRTNGFRSRIKEILRPLPIVSACSSARVIAMATMTASGTWNVGTAPDGTMMSLRAAKGVHTKNPMIIAMIPIMPIRMPRYRHLW